MKLPWCSTYLNVKVEVSVTFWNLTLNWVVDWGLTPREPVDSFCRRGAWCWSFFLWGSGACHKVRRVKGLGPPWRLGGRVLSFARGRKRKLRWILTDEWAFFNCWYESGSGDASFLGSRESERARNVDHRLFIYISLLVFLQLLENKGLERREWIVRCSERGREQQVWQKNRRKKKRSVFMSVFMVTDFGVPSV